jgi:hypothetical protein
MKRQVQKPTLAEAKRASRCMRAIYLERGTKAQRERRRRFLEPDEERSTLSYDAGRTPREQPTAFEARQTVSLRATSPIPSAR